MPSIQQVLIDVVTQFKNDNKIIPIPVLEKAAARTKQLLDKNFAARGRWDGNAEQITFFSGGTNKWAPLAESTKKEYRKKGYELTPTLMRSGTLRNSISVFPKNNSIAISANVPYAQLLQEGGTINKAISIPAHQRRIEFAFGKKLKTPRWVDVKSHSRNMRLKMPPRPFISITPEESKQLGQLVASFLKK